MDNKQFFVAQIFTFLHFFTNNILHAEEKYPDVVGKRPDPIYSASNIYLFVATILLILFNVQLHWSVSRKHIPICYNFLLWPKTRKCSYKNQIHFYNNTAKRKKKMAKIIWFYPNAVIYIEQLELLHWLACTESKDTFITSVK
jgi:hypothetical protein